MKVSIVVPVYKVEKYLRKCLDSLINQTIDDYEIILINDGSPDNSQQIIDEYKARYPEMIKTLLIDNGGQGRARNFGIDMAQGDYIGFVDSDDWVDVTMFEKLYNAAKANDADLVLCDCVACREDGGREYMNTSVYDDPMCVSGSVWNKLFRRDTIGDVRFASGVWYEDLPFALKLMLQSKKTAIVSEGLYFYRVSPASTMRNNNAKKNLDIITIMEDIRSFMESNGYTEGFDTVVINHVLLDSINRVAKQNVTDRQTVIKALRDYVHTYIPKLTECTGYKRERLSRRIIMWLNYHGLEKISVFLLKVKSRM